MPDTEQFDALIIGSGQAGNPLANDLVAAGRRVALVEEYRFGGSCINYGCTPTKTMLAAAHRAHALRTAAELGVLGGKPRVDLAAVIGRKNEIVDSRGNGLHQKLLDNGVTALEGHATFTAPRTIQVTPNDGGAPRLLTAPLVFLNTGTRAAIPPVEGLAHIGYYTNQTLLELRQLPEHLLILGGGYIALEFGQMFRRFGSRVTIVSSNARLLEHEDDDVCAAMQELLEGEGIEIVLGADTHRASQNEAGGVTLSARTPGGERRLRGSHLLVAVGRTPNTDRLGLEVAGIETDEHGYIRVNERLQTNVRGVYALGDVHGGPQFTHISYDDYRIVRDNLLHGKRRTTRHRPVPYVVFTDPQLGRVGLSEQQARKQGLPYRVSTLPVARIGRAGETNQTTGFLKVLVGPDDRLLGTAVFAPEGGELMSMLQIAMTGRLRYQQLQDLVLAHPTWAEALNNVFQDLEKPASGGA